MKDVLGIVLGGGKGTRLFPLTLVRSKPAVPLGGKYRIIDIPITNCLNSDVNKIFVLTQYNSASLNRHITQTYKFGTFSEGFVDILAAEQTPESAHWFQGTADAVRQTLRHFLNYNARDILVLAGDQLYRLDFRLLREQHRERKADITVCVRPVEIEQASRFGILKMNSDFRISEFHEKPTDKKLIQNLQLERTALRRMGLDENRPLMSSMGIYMFRTEVLVDVLKDETTNDFGRDVIPAALSSHSVVGYVFSGYWEDIGTIGSFYRANMDLTTPNPSFNLYDSGFPIYTRPRFLPASRIENCRIEQSIISEGCSIANSHISHSVIGIRSVIRENTRLLNTLMMGADFYEADGACSIPVGIGANTHIQDAIIDKNVRIGDCVHIVNEKKLREHDGGNYFIREGIVIIPKNAVMEPGTRI
ncbi:MAG: glucose-1-phosphate adenylyltransferase [Acidobacteria bacterium]|nr:glucose-1-phosphate adenylyltransferase [Acidobacteriota bacterium]